MAEPEPMHANHGTVHRDTPDAAPRRRGRFDAVVESNRVLCREHFELRLRLPGGFPATLPGQFVQLGCRPPAGAMDPDAIVGRELEWAPGRPIEPHQPELCGPLALLRRPFSLAGRGDDSRGAWIDIVGRVVGTGTDYLAHLSPGEPIDLIGPLGNAFDLPTDKHLALLVGGGVGLPPMFYLAERLRGQGWDAVAFVGAMTADLLAVDFVDGADPLPDGLPSACVRQFARLGYPSVVTTDDGSLGTKGRITTGLAAVLESLPADKAAGAVVFTCGPEPMMQAVAAMAQRRGVACQVCVEQAMACGMGTCQSCIVKLDADALGEPPHGSTAAGRAWRYKLACTDGPVFRAQDVVW